MKPIPIPVCCVAAMSLPVVEGLRADQVTLNVAAEAEVRQTIATDIDELPASTGHGVTRRKRR